jgi:hypothetical protein
MTPVGSVERKSRGWPQQIDAVNVANRSMHVPLTLGNAGQLACPGMQMQMLFLYPQQHRTRIGPSPLVATSRAACSHMHGPPDYLSRGMHVPAAQHATATPLLTCCSQHFTSGPQRSICLSVSTATTRPGVLAPSRCRRHTKELRTEST